LLDLRDVPSGGDSSVALGIMGRFVHTPLAYQRHRIPNYGQADVERNWLELVAPRGPFTYDAPVVVLVDHWTGSMGEGMAIGLDAMGRALVVGTPMAHLAGAVSDFTLPRTGIDVAFATEQLYHVNGKPRQDWLPPVLLPDTAPEVLPGASAAADPVLARGLAELQRLIARAGKKQ
jgi:C-terminal processing protease CtpA/Prc